MYKHFGDDRSDEKIPFIILYLALRWLKYPKHLEQLLKLNYNAYTAHCAQYLRNTVTQLKKIKEMAGVIYNNL